MKQRKKLISKALAMMLSLVMMLSMGITVFADSITNDTTGSFTVNGLDGSEGADGNEDADENEEVCVTVNAYKIIDVTIDNDSGQPKYPMYTWNTAVATWVRTYYPRYIGEDGEVIDFNSISADQMDDFLQKMTAKIKDDTITLNGTSITSESTSATFTNMPMGVYLLTASGGVKLYQPTTVLLVPDESEGSWTITAKSVIMKSNDPKIEKEVTVPSNTGTAPDKTVAIGDTVNYKLTVDVPDYPANASAVKLVVKDNLSSGLTFNSGSIKVYLGENTSTGEPVNATDNYTLPSPTGDYDFEIEFKDTFIRENAGSKLTITYSATVNENAFEKDTLGNTACIGYYNDPYDTSSDIEKTASEQVYTYGIQLTKYKEDDSGKTVIDGAEFSLSKSGGGELRFSETATAGVYVLDNNNGSTTVEVASDGKLLLKGLDAGVYVLKETKAPSGCMLPSGEITINITDSDPEDGTIDSVNVTTSGSSQVESQAIDTTNSNVIKFNVINQDSTFTLPQTGGMGTLLFTILGISFMAGAVAMMIVISKKRKA